MYRATIDLKDHTVYHTEGYFKSIHDVLSDVYRRLDSDEIDMIDIEYESDKGWSSVMLITAN